MTMSGTPSHDEVFAANRATAIHPIRLIISAAHLSGKFIGEIIAIQVRRRDDIKILRPRQHLLKRDVGNRIFNNDPGSRASLGDLAPWAPIYLLGAEEIFGDLVSPVAEASFR